jgi:hypothetical protein
VAVAQVLEKIAHRPYPLPNAPWVMTQWWRDLLFAHWSLPTQDVQALLPAGLEVDVLDGKAWVAVVPFRMTAVRPRGIPRMPWVSDFAELNVRTYVRPQAGGPPGVYFWSLEASNPLAVAVARRFFHLRYMHATMQYVERDGWVNYASERTHSGEHPARFEARYRPVRQVGGDARVQWLTERYCLYTTDAAGRIYRGDIHHERWPLWEAEAEITENGMARAAGLHLPEEPPLLHFAREIEVLIYPLQRLT